MGDLERRLERLEEQFKSGEQANPSGGTSPREWEHLFFTHQNARRALRGLEPLSPLKYIEEDRENDLDTLRNTLPVYRASAGWQSERDQAWLDSWEEQLKERIRKGTHD